MVKQQEAMEKKKECRYTPLFRCDPTASHCVGADDRTRTGTDVTPRDFKSLASAISPHRHEIKKSEDDCVTYGQCQSTTSIAMHNPSPPNYWRHHPDLNWGVKLLQSSALPLGYGAITVAYI